MKSYKIKLLSIVMLAFFASCDDFLELTPEDRIDSSSFFSNDEEMIIAVNGVYAAQRAPFTRSDGGVPTIFTALESRSDNAGSDHTDQAERVETDIFNESPGNLILSSNWESMWNAVNLANKVIASGATAEGDQSIIDRTVAEAKFIRAFIYFHMVNIWGGLPLRTEPTEDFSNTVLPRSSVTETYALIIKDLTEAAGVLPESYNDSPGSEKGRATKGAALTLMGKAHLQNGNKPEAEAALRQVLGKYSLLPDYADIHRAGNDVTDEAIFELNFNPANQTAWPAPSQFVPQSVANALGTNGSTRAVLAAYPTQDLIDSFDPADLRIPSTFDFATTGNYIGPYISKFIEPGATNGSDINFVALRYADVLLMLAEAIGEGAEAYDLINEVRNRADLPDIDASSPGTFMEKIMNERRWEFAFELSRWTDLLRLPSSELFSIMEPQVEAQLLNKFGITRDITLSDKNLLFPIPQSEIDISDGVVEQNPGY